MDTSKSQQNGWVLALVPYSVTVGPLGTLLTLEIASLRGSPVDVGYAMSAGSAAGVIAPIVWGLILDKYGGRRVLNIGFLGTALFVLALAYAHTIPQIALYYAAASLFSSAVGIAASLMIVDSSVKVKWNEEYSRLNSASSLGYLLGNLAAAVLSGFLSIELILLLMGLLPLVSMLWSIIAVPKVNDKVVNKVVSGRSLVGGFTNLGNLMDLLTLYLAIIIFYVSSGIFNTLYPYGLRESGLSKSWVMTIMTVNLGVQIIGFKLAPWLISKFGGNAKAASRSLVIRGLSYVLIGLTTSMPSTLILTGLTLYPLAAGVAYSTFFTASNVMVFERLRDEERGKGLGVYNLITGSAYLTGSLSSGYLASTVGIGESYVIAGVMLWGSAYLFNWIDKGKVIGKVKAYART